MIRLMIGDLHISDWAKLCLYELEIKNEAGTYAVVKALQKIYPDTEFFFIMGADQTWRIREWRNSRKLLREVPIYAGNRYGYPSPAHSVCSGHKKSLRFSIPPDHLAVSISSSFIRKAARENGVIPYVTGNVSDYIKANNLYKGK
jgi:nicotinate-nucleotide adenylyltransferase